MRENTAVSRRISGQTDSEAGGNERLKKSQRDDGSLTHAPKIQAAHTH